MLTVGDDLSFAILCRCSDLTGQGCSLHLNRGKRVLGYFHHLTDEEQLGGLKMRRTV